MFRKHQGDWEEPFDPKLAEMFRTYREATPDPEPGPDFQPQLWRRIEAKRTFTFSLKRLTQAIVTAAAAASLAMGIFLSQSAVIPTGTTYVEMLAADQSHDAADADELPVDFTSVERAR